VLRAVAFAMTVDRDLNERIIVGVELRRFPADNDLEMKICAAVLADLSFSIDEVVLLPKTSIPHTTSGKVQRARARELFRAGELGAAACERVA
jgi:hypothetical protein